MKKGIFSLLTTGLVFLLLFVGMMTVSASATGVDPDIPISVPEEMTLVSDVKTTLAPGVTEHKVTVLDSHDRQVVMFVVVADVANFDTVDVYAGYKNNDPTVPGSATVTEQVAAAEAKHGEPYTVVAGFNASYPYGEEGAAGGLCCGPFVMGGVDATTAGDAYCFFAVLKDGTYLIGDAGEYATHKGNIAEAVGGQLHLINNGEKAANLDDTRTGSRQTLGLTVDGKVVLVTVDSSAHSAGVTVREQADLMEALGCVEAIHLHDGGATTYASRPEGGNRFAVTNTPAGGAEQAVGNSLMIVSRAVSDGVFDHVVLTPAADYVTPGSTVALSVVGVDAAGGAAALPANLTLELADSKLGSIVNGCLVAGSAKGDAIIYAKSGGKVVGETVVHVVTPDSLSFDETEVEVPYGLPVRLPITAKYGVHTVALKDGDVLFTLGNYAAGSLKGFTITGCDESAGITNTQITATLSSNIMITARGTLKLTPASVVVEDFEDKKFPYTVGDMFASPAQGGVYDGTVSGGYGNGSSGALRVVTAETGKVRNGQYALALTCDFSQFTTVGTRGLNVLNWELEGLEDARAIGFWIYIPEGVVDSTCFRFHIGTADSTVAPVDLFVMGEVTMEVDNWYYVSADLSGLAQPLRVDRLEISYSAVSTVASPNRNTKFTVYIDDVTVDYFQAVNDREAPVFGTVSVKYAGTSAAMDGQAIPTNTLTLTVGVSDVAAFAQALAGLDLTSVKVYVDGVLLKDIATCSGAGVITTGEITLANGLHSFTIEIADRNGNVSRITRTLILLGNQAGVMVDIVPANPASDRLMLGSLHWLKVVTNSVEDLDSVTFTMKLNTLHSWEPEHMIVADGFRMEYVLNTDTMELTVTLTRTRDTGDTGSSVLVELPLRVYAYTLGDREGFADFSENYVWYQEKQWYVMTLVASSTMGAMTLSDGTVAPFSVTPLTLRTECYDTLTKVHGAAGVPAGTNGWHIHKVAPWNREVSCTLNGYTGGTYCADCGSVVTWGTRTPATGHHYTEVAGVMTCDCGELLNGVYEGRAYENGLTLQGWVDGKYYEDGVALVGTHVLGNAAYVFDEEGNLDVAASAQVNGMLEYRGKRYFAQNGLLISGWKGIEGVLVDSNPADFIVEDTTAYYYFKPDTYEAFENGFLMVDGQLYEFENGILVNANWEMTEEGMRLWWAGNYRADGWAVICGEVYYISGGYAVTGAFSVETFRQSGDYRYYLFNEYGVMERMIHGIHDGIYYRDGQKIPYLGLVEFEGNFYYVGDFGKIITNQTRYIANTNGLCWADGTPIKSGTYIFDAEGRMTAIPKKNGVIDGVYYENDLPVWYKGLVLFEGHYYYVVEEGKVVKGGEKNVATTNGLLWPNGLEVKTGVYTFDAEGKLLLSSVKNGLVDGVYYENHRVVENKGLIEINGSFYYIVEGGKPVAGGIFSVSNTNGLTRPDGTLIVPGNYFFDPDGKMLEQYIKNGLVDGVYYENDSPVWYKGLILFEGSYYYISDHAKPVVGGDYNVATTNGLRWADGTVINRGIYSFDAEGKLLLSSIKNGLVDGVYYENHQVVENKGLIEFEGDFYYIVEDGKPVAGGIFRVSNPNGLLRPDGTSFVVGDYFFDPDGKLLEQYIRNGLVDGIYYENDSPVWYKGLIFFEGSYYYISDYAKPVVSGDYNVGTTNGLLWPNGLEVKTGIYSFDAEGKLILTSVKNGLVDGIYYENHRVVENKGLIEVDGDFYYIVEGGKPVAGGIFRVSNPNGLLRPDGTSFVVGDYIFGLDGKLIEQYIRNGLVDGIYYENDTPVWYKGLILVEGHYYYIAAGAKPVVGGDYNVGTTNGLLWPNGLEVKTGIYSFDAEGKLILTSVKNGLVDGVYYENHRVVENKGLIEIDGSLYYIVEGGKPVADGIFTVSNTNGLLFADGTPVEKGNYIFAPDGKLVERYIRNGLVDGVYYEDDTPVWYKGLILFEGNYYYIVEYGKPAANREQNVSTTNGLTWADGTVINTGIYAFDAEGKLILSSVKNGVVDGVYYENHKPVENKGLIEFEGAFYYVVSKGVVVKNGVYEVANVNGLTQADGTPFEVGNYVFDADGKLVKRYIRNGLVDGVYYENDEPVWYKGLIKFEGAYYYIAEQGKPVTSSFKYVSTTNGLTWEDGTPIEEGYYQFDAQGKLIP